jgi:hypothetical protein
VHAVQVRVAGEDVAGLDRADRLHIVEDRDQEGDDVQAQHDAEHHTDEAEPEGAAHD